MAEMMQAKDAVAGSLAECYVTLGKNRYNFMQLYEFESSYEFNIVDVPILGRVTKGNKPIGGKGTWSGTAHYNQSVLRQIAYDYQTTGVIQHFDIQVTNEDKTSSIGRQTIILKDCLMDSITLAKYNADEELLTEDVSGTFESWEMPEKFKMLEGM